LQTVADAIGVSRSTVSNAYSRPDQLSPDLRRRILDTARRVGYAGPNPTARSLRRGRAGTLGVLFTASLPYAFTDPYAVQFLRGLAESVGGQETGLLLVPQSVDDTGAAVSNAAVDGFCVFCMPDWHPSWDAIEARGLPVVSAQRRPTDGPETLFVGIDDADATRAAGRHLTQLGHRRVAVIGDHLAAGPTRPVTIATPDDVAYYGSRERLRGYYEAIREAGVDWTDVTTISTDVNSKEAGTAGTAAAAYLLDQAHRPTAVVAFSDILALGVLDALAARGLRPGEDISVIGFDDIPEAAQASLTTVRQPATQRGRLSGQLLLDPPKDPSGRQIVLPTELVIRDTTRPAV
jgi:DNA-binding LacI/PurR family transcriptional regulator